MKNFKDYLTEGAKKYDFRIKIAADVSKEQEVNLKEMLSKYQVSAFKKSGQTPIQELPLDFPKIKNRAVNIYEVTLDYPTTQWELLEYLCTALGFTQESMVIRRDGEPSEQYQTSPGTKRDGALLQDPNYTESPNAKMEDFFGDKYNSGFVKELNDILKLQKKERSEHIPETPPAKFITDSDQHNTSVLTQSSDPRK